MHVFLVDRGAGIRVGAEETPDVLVLPVGVALFRSDENPPVLLGVQAEVASHSHIEAGEVQET